MAVSQQKNLKAPRTSNDRPFRPSPRAALPRFACRPARRGGKPHLALARGMRHERMISPHVSFVMRSAGRLKHKVRAQHRSPKIPLHSPRTLPSSGRPHGAHDHRLCLGRPVTIRGSEGPDSLTGTPGRDVISGRGGDDVVSGMVGRAVLIGGAGADMLTGGPARTCSRAAPAATSSGDPPTPRINYRSATKQGNIPPPGTPCWTRSPRNAPADQGKRHEHFTNHMTTKSNGCPRYGRQSAA
jgi:hypothetical protein